MRCAVRGFLWCLLAVGLSVDAHVLTERECMRAAADVYLNAIDAGKGATLEAQITEAQKGLAACRVRTPLCAYKDAQDDARVFQYLAWLHSPDAEGHSPKEIAQHYFDSCKAAIPPAGPNDRTDGPAKETDTEKNS